MRSRRAATAALLALLTLALLPAVALGHSKLVSSTPTDGAVLAEPPAEIGGDFSEAVDPARSSMELRGPDGARIATGGVPEGGPVTRMTIAGLPDLAPGTYEVRWTTVTPDDNGVERGTFAFTVAAATPSPVATPTPPAPPSAAATLPVATPTAVPATPIATSAPTDAPAPLPAPDAATGDLLLPLAVLAAVLVGGGAWLALRRR